MSGHETVLVVDDSAVDRRLAGKLVAKRGFVPIYAADGQEALDEIARARPSIVVTDLHMPRLNGLELVAAIRKTYPTLPVVLMTAHGTEELSVLALKTGAASFVPKRRLARELAPTLDAIIQLSHGARGRTSVVDPLVAHETRVELGNDVERLPEVVGQLEADLMRLGICDETQIIQVGVALREAIVNAILHGNLELSSTMLDDEDGVVAFTTLATARRSALPFSARRVQVAAQYAPGEVVYTISDEGPGFDPDTVPDPTESMNLERSHGRGLMLMRMFMDEVEFGPGGNVVTMRKRRA